MAAVLLFTRQPARTGDGTQYLLTTVAFGETRQPFITQKVIDRYNDLLQREPLRAGFPVLPQNFSNSFYGQPIPVPSGLSYEPLHFWFLGLMTAPYYWITQETGRNFADSYTLLFASLWLVMVLAAYRFNGIAGLTAATILALFSPVLWFVDKPQTEFLTFFCVLMAVILIDAELSLWAAAAMAIAATQNPALLPLVAVLLGCWLWVRRGRMPSRADALLCTATALLIVVPPGYYFARHGIFTPLIGGGFSSSENITFKRIVSLFIDPDIGLYPNWPLGALALAVGVAAAIPLIRRHKAALLLEKIREKPLLWIFTGAFLAMMPLAHATQGNFNHGGTVNISRYALWYIPLHYPLVLYALRRLSGPVWTCTSLYQKVAVLAGVCIAVLAICFNLICFAPQRGEVSERHSLVARIVYDRFPAVFDPTPEVFIGRTGNLANPVARGVTRIDPKTVMVGPISAFDAGIWAFAAPSCRKLYVLSGMLGRANASLRPPGCAVPVDPGKLLRDARAHGGNRDFYLNLSAAEIRISRPLLAVGRQLGFASPELDQYLGQGWSVAEAGFRWTDGPVASIAFRVSKEDLEATPSRRFVLRLDAAGITVQQPEQVVRAVVNGEDAAVYSWARGEQRKVMQIPVTPDETGSVQEDLRILSPFKPGNTGESRALGLLCYTMELTRP